MSQWRCLAGWYSMYADWEEGGSCSPSATDLVRHYLEVEGRTFADIHYAADALFEYANEGTTLEEQWNFLDVYTDDDARYECDGCQRIGTADDLIRGDGDECPDEDCDGTVHRIMEES